MPDEPARQVLVLLEPGVASGPALGTIVQEMLVNLRGGLAYLGRREKVVAARKVLRGMASELTSLATFLDIQLPDERSEEKGGNGLPAAASRTSPEAAGLAPAVIPPATPASETPGNGHKPNPPRGGRPPTEPLPQRTGSQMLRKGMTMVLEGRIQKKGGYGEPPSRPADPEKMQQQIDRWARSGGLEGEVPEGAEEDAGGSASAWPPPLPSSDQ
jgi:hypothetical protein